MMHTSVVCLVVLLLPLLMHSFHHQTSRWASSTKLRVSSNTEDNHVTPKRYSEVMAESAASSVLKGAATIGSVVAMASKANAAETKPKKAKKPKILETDEGIKYLVVKKGSGPYPNPGDFVVINYSAFLKNGTMFDSTELKGRKPLSFRYGQKQVIPGVEAVLNFMQPGAEYTCTIPAQYAYGSKGVCIEGEGCLVPPDSDLNYVIKLLQVGAGYN